MNQAVPTSGLKAKHQRLILAVLAVIAVIAAGLLAASALKDEAAYFYSPSDISTKHVAPGQAIRLGGMVLPGSLKKMDDGISIRFEASDGKANVPVQFKGIVPDLFKEGSGMVADGHMGADGVFMAEKILAKHDENYMPPQMEISDEARANISNGANMNNGNMSNSKANTEK